MKTDEFEPRRLLIGGVGLIGGCVALAARRAWPNCVIVGWGRSRERLEHARQLGVIDEAVIDPGDAGAIDLAVVCTPVDRIASDIRQLLQASPPPQRITDAGSVKASIIHELRGVAGAHQRFLGAHPLAGSHHTGFEHAAAEILRGRLCVLTPVPETPVALIQEITSFWRQLGMRVESLSPDQHDAILARTSHLPHLTAAVLASTVTLDDLRFAATGFRDTTRVAAGDPDLWTQICLRNADALARSLSDLQARLNDFYLALQRGDASAVRGWLADGAERRKQFPESTPSERESEPE